MRYGSAIRNDRLENDNSADCVQRDLAGRKRDRPRGVLHNDVQFYTSESQRSPL